MTSFCSNNHPLIAAFCFDTGGYLLQAYGLEMTTAARGAFTSTFTVVAVPLLVGLSGRHVAWQTWASAGAFCPTLSGTSASPGMLCLTCQAAELRGKCGCLLVRVIYLSFKRCSLLVRLVGIVFLKCWRPLYVLSDTSDRSV